MKLTPSTILSALLATMPLMAQEAVAPPAPAALEITAIPVEEVNREAQNKQFEEIKATDEHQNVVLNGLSEQVNTQRLLLQDSKGAIQEQTVLYTKNLQRIASLEKELKAAILSNAQLKEKVSHFDKSLSLSDGEAMRKSQKMDAFILEFGREMQKQKSLEKSLGELSARVDAHRTSLELDFQQFKSSSEKLETSLSMIQSDVQGLKYELEAQVKSCEEKATNLALQLAQTKIDLVEYKAAHQSEQDELVASMAAGMILLFICFVTLAFIHFTNGKRLKAAILAGVSAKLQEASQEIRQLTKPEGKAKNPTPKPRRQR